MSKLSNNSSLFLLFAACFFLVGCGTAYHKEDADKEVYGIISHKGGDIGGMPSQFSIEPDKEPVSLDPLASDPIVLSIEDALEIAVENSRDYQRQKESLYSQGLSLTLARHQFDPIFSGSASGETAKGRPPNSRSCVPPSPNAPTSVSRMIPSSIQRFRYDSISSGASPPI